MLFAEKNKAKGGGEEMTDEMGNKDSFELALDQAVGDAVNEHSGRQKSSMLVEDDIGASMWAKDPISRFEIITKDLTMANLLNDEVLNVRTHLLISKECAELGFKKDAEFFEFMADLICDSSLAINGFAHKNINVSGRQIEFKGQIPGAVQAQKQQAKKADWRRWIPI